MAILSSFFHASISSLLLASKDLKYLLDFDSSKSVMKVEYLNLSDKLFLDIKIEWSTSSIPRLTTYFTT